VSINLNVDVSGISALLQRASALIAGNRAQHGANERLVRVKERAGDLDLAGKGARQKMADAFDAAAAKRLAEQQRQQDSWADRKPIGHRHGEQYPVATAGYAHSYSSDYADDNRFYEIIFPINGPAYHLPDNREWVYGNPFDLQYNTETYPASIDGYTELASDQTSDSIRLTLPVSKDTFILVSYRYYQKSIGLVTNSDSYRAYKDAPGFEGTWSIHGVPDPRRIYNVSYYDHPRYGFTVAYDYDAFWGYQYPLVVNSGYDEFQCTVVNKNSARSLAMPAALKAKLKTILYGDSSDYKLKYTPESLGIAQVLRRNAPFEEEVIGTYEVFIPAVTHEYFNYKKYIRLENYVSLGLTGPRYGYSAFGNPLVLHPWNPSPYGYTYLRGTPSVYQWLANPVEAGAQYAEIASVPYYSSKNPPVFVDGAASAGETTFVVNPDGTATLLFPFTKDRITVYDAWLYNYFYADWYPILETPNLANANYKTCHKVKVPAELVNKIDSRLEHFNRITFASAWDWGRPGYCRQQLLALGFTAADLTP
jgi:hypothetical protein